ncbi:MAG TPA: methylmalonyl-CoA mutase [Polyangiaceae bacterium]|nr:methylmalonyl-CoA mutase [Polyangiaceae bacterium]
MSTDPRETWRELARAELDGAEPDSLVRELPEGLAQKPLYLAADAAALPFTASVPGEFPYLRGVRATMYAKRPWTLRQYAGFSTAEETNAFFRSALAAGQTGLSVAFDLATHRGYDSDHARVKGDVGKAGVAIDSVEDMKRLFEGIPLDRASVSMTMNGAVLPVLAAFIVAGEEQGVPAHKLTGTIQNDILKEFLVRNTFVYPPAPSLRIVADVIEQLTRALPRFNSLSISGYHMQEAGATAELELGYTLADGLEYVRAGLARGLDIDAFAPRLSFFFGIGMSFFVEIAKLRAARVLWATLVKERFAPKDPRSLLLRTHCQTSGVSLTVADPLNNVARTTLEALAAVLGGTQSLHTNAYDEALALPSDGAARVARATQLILEHETGVPHVVDPLGGSYYVESLTHELVERARGVIDEVEAGGGMARAIESGLARRRIEAAAARRQARRDRGAEVVVGVNAFRADDAAPLSVRIVDTTAVREAQCARLVELRRTRDAAAVKAALEALRAAARGDGNLLAASVVAARARATVGEISEALADVFGRYEATAGVLRGVYGDEYGDDAEWSALKERVAEFARRHGRRPRILVAKLGQDGHDRGQKVVASGLADLGFDVDLGPLFTTPEEVARHAIENDVHVVGISSQAGAHVTLVPELRQALVAAGAGDVRIVCGGIIPPADLPGLSAAGVAAVFGPGTRVADAAKRLLDLFAAEATPAPHG